MNPPDEAMLTTAVLGFAHIGPERELKFALEAFWRDEARSRTSSRSVPISVAGISSRPQTRAWM